MKKSFTLIELIVVIAIIAILAAIITPNAVKAIEKAKIARAVLEIKTIETAVSLFYADTGKFPCTKAGGWGKDPGFVTPITAAAGNCWPDEISLPFSPASGDCTTPGVCIDIVGWAGPYMDKWPSSSPWSKVRPGVPAGRKGGMYNWNYWISRFGCSPVGVITLEIYGAVPVNSIKRIDEAIDDGNLTGGIAFISGILEDPGTFEYIVACD